MVSAGQWDDLAPRVATGLGLIAFGILDIAIGGIVFCVTVASAVGLIFWEMLAMMRVDNLSARIAVAVLAVICVVAARALPFPVQIAALLIPALLGLLIVAENRGLFLIYALGVMVAAAGLVMFRDVYGGMWLFWLVVTVVLTDVAGYFAGRLIGGIKFWPRVSPKKTWAGILAGWGAAAGVAIPFVIVGQTGFGLVLLGVFASFASQMGDIAESALKRQTGVKDSSGLLPGHGGVFDRFDGLLGASLFMLCVAHVIDVPTFPV